ncbi:hypothetical protein QR680_003812 [Steinernema hermaphroditum]|uniref:Uncharacterized protein n=1 Tax=Steinernema hermaphroditum TaxID=289476 RepID=A0AA39LSZ0_9BILA|nr:hypothetical protein QR680_003812 [Steinernema hermaphroditum]
MTSDKDEKALVECLRLLMDANFKYITFWGGGDQQQYEEENCKTFDVVTPVLHRMVLQPLASRHVQF